MSSQDFNFFNTSLLLNQKRDNLYKSITFSQDSTIGGIAILVNRESNNTFKSTQLSQGIGIAGGFGALVDLNGNDLYFSKGLRPSNYGDPGQFDGWSQGVGIGYRGFVSGGVGLLYDRSGRDRFEAGTFSQGGGYYFGIGFLINDGLDDDFYQGSRYAQGFAAHYAVGSLLDLGGNDTYKNVSHVGEAIAWDLSLSLFEDFAGNDKYVTCEHCLGAASQNSISFFIDHKGNDTYSGEDLPLQGFPPNDYHSGISLGFFMDKGGEDSYLKFKNNSTHAIEGWRFYIDSK
jgi:hypothetical protein